MKSSELLDPVINVRGGIILDGEDGKVLLLDRFLRGVLRLPRVIEPPLEAGPILKLVDRFYTRIAEYAKNKSGRFVLHVDLDDILHIAAFRSDLARTLDSLSKKSSLDLVIHFFQPPGDWPPLLDWLIDVKKLDLRKNANARSIKVYIQGPFGPVGDDYVKMAFVQLGTQLGYVIDWWTGPEKPEAGRLPSDAISELAHFGFRIPIIYYVHADNIDQIWTTIEEVEVLNQYSGFSLPLVCCHPKYTFAPGQPALPAADVYGKLLAQAFDDLPHYADICYPINELAGFVGSGGWNEERDVPLRIGLLAKPDVGIAMFRQVPAFARVWIAWPELLTQDEHAIVPFLLERYRKAFPWSTNTFCGRCQWRYVCGGTDGWDGRSDSAATTLKAVCHHRMQLLDLFCREKIGMMLPNGS